MIASTQHDLLDASGLLHEARRQTGIDIEDTAATEPLRRLIDSINKESRLHAAGALAMHDYLLRLLCNRLRMQRDIATHPEILEETLRPPIILLGPPRSGTTKLHKLLAASGDFNSLTFWKSFSPALYSGDRNESPQPRIEDTDRYAAWFREKSPQAKAAHEFVTHDPEEESFLLEHSLMSPVFTAWSVVDDYLRWLFRQSTKRQLEYLRDSLKYLQWQGQATSTKRWLLKCPLYCGSEPALLDVFPDASLVMNHRDPIETVPSSHRLIEVMHTPYTDYWHGIDHTANGRAVVHRLHLENRASIPAGQMLDVHYTEVVSDVERLLRKTYALCNEKLTPHSLDAMMCWNASNPKNVKGSHQYSLDAMGVDKGRLAKSFAAYNQLVQDLFPEMKR